MTLAHTLTQTFRAAFSALGRELTIWNISRARATFGAEAMLSVALAVALANALNLSDTWWAAISGFAVMQTSFAGSVQRAAHRMLGTVTGAALGVVLGPWIGDRPWLFVPVLGAIGGIAVYRANGSRASYAWILGGVTALMVTYEAHRLVTFRATTSFATLRIAEVAVGTLACLVVASAFHFGAKGYRLLHERLRPQTSVESASGETGAMPPDSAPAAPLQSARSTRLLLGVQSALSIAILASLTYALHLPGFAQAMVTAIAVSILPAGLALHETRQPAWEKMVQRVAGCLLAGVIAVVLLPLMHGQAVPCVIALSIGVWAGCHVQTGREGASYVGRQFTIAFIMVFVQDHRWSADPAPALMRLSGILMGIVVLTVVMLATDRLLAAPRPHDARQ
ncbi:FUSC family protein [Paraburkholderia sp. D15]|uniref:FUSC family protein n=1 Tax=Paraburkholderia sp. D15 TaxID=2880218 RepID=UPI0024798FD1|nr:FUSC family protein [Paraburkholderia sp. D15]WGS48651.1 FUSC family protein [Paraburkholderia sp. D15]